MKSKPKSCILTIKLINPGKVKEIVLELKLLVLEERNR